MGKIKQGILGGFSGKVGPVIGSSWKGKAVIKARALSYYNPNTELQQQVRARFGLISKFISATYNFIKIGFAKMADDITEQNAALATNFDNCVTGTWPNYELAYSNLIVSKGKVDLPYSPAAAIDSNTLSVSWTDNSGTGNAESGDTAMILVYNATKQQALYDVDAAQRSERAATLTIPSLWNGDTVEVYMAMHREKEGEASKSFYLGSFTI